MPFSYFCQSSFESILRQKLKVYFFLILLLLLSIIWAGCESPSFPKAKKGIINLSEWNFDKDGAVRLDGEWLFYWKQKISTDRINQTDYSNSDGYISLPGSWDGLLVKGIPITEDGFATMTLQLKLNPNDTKKKGLLILGIHSAYTLWINGKKATSNGTVATTFKDEKFKPFYRHLIDFEPKGNMIQMVLQVSNFNHSTGGVIDSLVLGRAEALDQRNSRFILFDQFVNGSVLALGLFFLLLYSQQRNDCSYLLFSVYCLLWAFNLLCVSLIGSYPDFGTELRRIENILYYLTFPAMALFLKFIYPKESVEFIVRFFLWVAAIFTVLAIFSDYKSFTAQWNIYLAITILFLIYSLYVGIRAVRNRRTDAIVVLFGIIVVTITAVLDIIFQYMNKITLLYSSLGLFLFALSIAISVSKRFSRAYQNINQLSKELIEKNETLSSLDRLKDEFLANTTHELKTPLHGMIGIADSLVEMEESKLSSSLKNNLSLITTSGRRLSKLIDDILDYSKLRHKEIRLQLEPVDLKSNVDLVIRISEQLIKEKPIHLINNTTLGLPPVHADANRLQQILYNLIGNAIKYTDEGEVSISTRLVKNQVEISISDTGIGIPAEKFKDIFNSFEQVDNEILKGRGGTGLGLSLTKQLVEMHHSVITVNSTFGKGSVFSFHLNICDELPTGQNIIQESSKVQELPDNISSYSTNQEAHLDTGLVSGSSDKSDILVLAVDDEPINLSVISNYLVPSGINVETVSSGQAALEFIESVKVPDLILLDIMMPNMTGYDVCKHIRGNYSKNDLAVIMLTAKNGLDDLKKGFDLGANDYITKPFSKDELIARTHSCIKTQKGYNALKENLLLKKELESRKKTEQELRITHHLLSDMLNRIDSTIVAFNECDEISFYNDLFEETIGLSQLPEYLLGKPISVLFTSKSLDELNNWKNESQCQKSIELNISLDLTYRISNKKRIKRQTECQVLEIGEERQFILIFREENKAKKITRKKGDSISGAVLIEEFNKNKERLHQLEKSLSTKNLIESQKKASVKSAIQVIEKSLMDMSAVLSNDSKSLEGQRKLIVDVMNLSVNYWQNSTGLTKAELAVKSNIWKIYIDYNGRERSQTLDKYLKIENLPKFPRLNKVLATAEYVLNTISDQNRLRDTLKESLSNLRMRI